jgi:hypothetical protein
MAIINVVNTQNIVDIRELLLFILGAAAKLAFRVWLAFTNNIYKS